jgi:hypothetical protein
MLLSNLIARCFFAAASFASAMLPVTDTGSNFNSKPSVKWAIEKTSSLRVEGKSNINSFRCDMQGYYHTDTITGFEEGGNVKPVRLKGAMVVDIFRFDCHHRMITSDLRKTLKAEQYPKMTIRFLSLEKMPEFIGNTELLRGLVEIELAGTKKKFDILYSFVRPGGKAIILNGGRTFSFADFKLVPPKKLAGMIQIKDSFDVNFRLMLTPLS